MYQLHEYPTTTAMNTTLATTISNNLQDAISQRSQASLALSGGPDIIELCQILSQMPLPWEKIYTTLVDDRWVDKEHKDSNERLLRTYLLQNQAEKAHFISLKTLADTPSDSIDEIHSRLQKTLPLPIDVLVLGMGEDGHTASLFPHTENLSKGLDMHSNKLVIDMHPLNAPHKRISLTLPAILNSRHLYLQLIGKKKQQIFQQAIAGKDLDQMPIRAVLQNRSNIQIYLAK